MNYYKLLCVLKNLPSIFDHIHCSLNKLKETFKHILVELKIHAESGEINPSKVYELRGVRGNS